MRPDASCVEQCGDSGCAVAVVDFVVAVIGVVVVVVVVAVVIVAVVAVAVAVVVLWLFCGD